MTMASTSMPAPPAPKQTKLGGYDFYKSIGSPKWVIAPMVDQSELAWRMLSRSPLPPALAGPSTPPTPEAPYTRYAGGAQLCYTPMIHAKVFSEAKNEHKGGDGHFNLTFDEEGSKDPVAGIEGGDRPLFVQFCANDPETLLAAARKVEHRCDAVDINFGCPQGIARKGHYGSFLQDDWELIKSLIGTLHENLSIPVTAKFRIFPDVTRTVAYARMMEAAGAQIITCHGRTREQKGQLTGLADWAQIKAVKEAVKIPVFANGNILYREDVDRCLEVTGCDGVMTSEGNLSNPALFLPSDHPHAFPRLTVMANRYLDIVASLQTPTSKSAVRSHLFRILKPELDRNDSLRQKIASCMVGPTGSVDEYREVLKEIDERAQPEIDEAGPSWRAPPIDPNTGYRKLPSYVVQPYIRPPPPPATSEPNPADSQVQAEETSGEKTNTAAPCMSLGSEPCGSMAAVRCPERACLVHCRQIHAIAGGMDPHVAAQESNKGNLVGKGCEAHEAKVLAKLKQLDMKRKAREQGRQAKKQRKIDAKVAEHKKAGKSGGGAHLAEAEKDATPEEDEEAMFNGISA